jgi:hypothetical protein
LSFKKAPNIEWIVSGYLPKLLQRIVASAFFLEQLFDFFYRRVFRRLVAGAGGKIDYQPEQKRAGLYPKKTRVTVISLD